MEYKEFFGSLSLILAGSIGAGYLASKQRQKKLELSAGAVAKLHSVHGPYRCHVLYADGEKLVLSAPLKSGHYVPLRPGDFLRVEIAEDDCVIIFRTHVAERENDEHQLVLKWPERFVRDQRRQESRVSPERFLPTELNGEPAVLVDYSRSGARVLTTQELTVGDLVQLEVPSRSDQALACVLEVWPDAIDGRRATMARLVFSEE